MALLLASPVDPSTGSISLPSVASSFSLAPSPILPGLQAVGVSPTTSSGTENTEIDDDEQATRVQANSTLDILSTASDSKLPDNLSRITTCTNLATTSMTDEEPRSAIYAPLGLPDHPEANPHSPPLDRPAIIERGLESPITPGAAEGPNDKRFPMDHSFEKRIETNGACSCSGSLTKSSCDAREDNGRAQDHFTALPELLSMQSCVEDTQRDARLSQPEQENTALQTAFRECWSLCNTLANLSPLGSNPAFGGKQVTAWQSCWGLCQKLYEDYNSPTSGALPILELCRDFSQALFEVRQRVADVDDSVLRVSFEMNNHLYNTHDRTLPEAFHERTLDFHVTLCHRMMKQGTILHQETEALLQACWALAEMLMVLRQAKKEPDSREKLFASAVQACWELCDLFRKSWSRSRPDGDLSRATRLGRPCGARRYTSPPRIHTVPSSSFGSSSSYHDALGPLATPITVFDDTTSASSPGSVSAPNILILGPCADNRGTQHDRWSSNVSTLSGYSESATSSRRTSSTATASTKGSYMERLQYLILKAAMNVGFCRVSSAQSFSAFVKGLQADAFGRQQWQRQLLGRYKRLVEADMSLRTVSNLPPKRLTVKEVAKAVDWLARDEKWAWMRELYRFACGMSPDEALRQYDAVLLSL